MYSDNPPVMGWSVALEMAKLYNLNYVSARITKTTIGYLIRTEAAVPVVAEGRGSMLVATPLPILKVMRHSWPGGLWPGANTAWSHGTCR